jgi:TonB-linked SusC/RagA family outer membrane protein
MLTLFSFSVSFAQKAITGTVTDDRQSPLSGATVTVKGTSVVTTTDASGRFRLTVPEGRRVLEVSFVGMQPQEVTLGDVPVVAVSLTANSSTLSDVVVIGYGTRRRAEVTSSISSIGAKEIRDMPVAGIDQAMQGKVAGVTVTNNSGQPGGGVSVRVRGITSVNSSEPLYVIDGVLMSATSNNSTAFNMLGGGGGQTSNSVLATLNPNDIESIDILKDASAQAIYGSQGANGVVIITTKKGRSGEGRLNYDAYYGSQYTPRMLPMLDLKEYARYQNAVSTELGTTPAAEFANPDVLGTGTNWQEAIFQRGSVQNHQMSFSGGQNKTNYYFSGNYFDQTGVIIGSGFKRYSMRFNLDQQVKTWLRAGISANGTKSKQKLTLADEQDGTITQALLQSPLIPVRNLDNSYGGPGTNVGGITYYQDNPVAKSEMRDVTTDISKMFGNMYIDVTVLKNISIRNEFAFDFQLTQNSAFQRGGLIGNTPLVSTLLEGRSNSLWYVLRNYANYNQTFAGKHNVSATIGHEAQTSRYDYINGQRYNLATNDLIALNAGAAADQTLGGGKGESAMESYFARAGYTYNNKYSLNLSYRADASSLFGPNNKWGYFPAASIGWTVSNEEFFSKIRPVNYLKIRVGYGAVGNQNPPGGAPRPPYTSNVRFTTNGFGAGSFPANLANPNLKWESVVTKNAGIDLSVLNRKLDVTLDVYNKVTDGMLIYASVPSFTGIGSNWNDVKTLIVNSGQMTNKGIDLTVTSHNINKKNFTWRTTGIFSQYKNVLDEYNNGASIDGTVVYGTILLTHTVQGHPVGSFYGLVTDGLFRSEKELAGSLPQFGLPINQNNGTWLGDVRFKDLNNDGVINDRDITFIGNPQPKFTYGLTNAFNYKGVDLSIFLQGSYGAKIFNYLRRSLEGLENQFYNQMETVRDRYTPANPEGSLPRFTANNKNNNAISDRWVEDGSYLRIQNVAIGYNLPKNLIRRAGLNNLRVYFSGQNLHTFTKYTGFDPEIGAYNQGITLMNIDNGHYPNPRSFTIGANLEF